MLESPRRRLCDTDTTLAFVVLSNATTQFDTKASTPPSQVAWCGEDAIAVVWQGASDDVIVGDDDGDAGSEGPRGGDGACLLLLGPFSDYVRMTPDDLFAVSLGTGLVVVQEMDGCVA